MYRVLKDLLRLLRGSPVHQTGFPRVRIDDLDQLSGLVRGEEFLDGLNRHGLAEADHLGLLISGGHTGQQARQHHDRLPTPPYRRRTRQAPGRGHSSGGPAQPQTPGRSCTALAGAAYATCDIRRVRPMSDRRCALLVLGSVGLSAGRRRPSTPASTARPSASPQLCQPVVLLRAERFPRRRPVLCLTPPLHVRPCRTVRRSPAAVSVVLVLYVLVVIVLAEGSEKPA